MELGGDKYRALKWNYVEKEKKKLVCIINTQAENKR